MTDREIDKLVAEKLFGWSFDWGGQALPAWGGFAPGVQGISVVPHFSTDMNEAMRAADHMRDKHDCAIELKIMPSYMPSKRYAALVCGGDLEYARSDITVYATDDQSPARALCLALLQAVGVQI